MPIAFPVQVSLVVGVDVQAFDADIDAIAALADTDGNFIVGSGTDWVAENGNTARTSLGLGTADSPGFNAVSLGTTPAATGTIRLANASPLKFRNAANSADVDALTVNASDQITLGAAGGGWSGVNVANDSSLNLGFFGSAPVSRAGTTDDIKDALVSYGLLQGTSATPLDLDGGSLTGGSIQGTAAGGGSSAAIRAASTGPAIEIRETGASLDNKSWDFLASSEDLLFRAVNDANSVATTYFQIERTGTTIDNVQLPVGNVGLGISPAAGEKLHVNGGIKAVTVPFFSALGTTDDSVGGTEATMAQMSISVTTDGSPIKLEFWAGYVNSSTPNLAFTTFRLKRDGTTIRQYAHTIGRLGRSDETGVTWVDTPVAGTYTYTVTWEASFGTSTSNAATNSAFEGRSLRAEVMKR